MSNPTQLSLFDPIEIQLTKGYVTCVDPLDADLALFKWIANGTPVYAKRLSEGVRMHRVIMCRILGREISPSELVDHIDGNSLNNRRINLRLATPTQNVWNSRIPITNTSGYKGVRLDKSSWRAVIRLNGRPFHLGEYADPITAAVAYNHAALKYHGEFARFNDIPGWQSIIPEKISKVGPSGYEGVVKSRNKWGARPRINGKRVYLGSFLTPEAAHEACLNAIAEFERTQQ